MNFEKFKKYFEYLEKFDRESEKVNKHLSEIAGRGSVCELGYNLYDGFIEMLSEIVDDKNEWIDYYVFECDFGRKPMQVEIFGEKIKLDSLEKLWRIIKS